MNEGFHVMSKGFIVEKFDECKMIPFKYIPGGTVIFCNDGEIDRVINWLQEVEKQREEIEKLKHRIADLEYSIHNCDRSHPYK